VPLCPNALESITNSKSSPLHQSCYLGTRRAFHILHRILSASCVLNIIMSSDFGGRRRLGSSAINRACLPRRDSSISDRLGMRYTLSADGDHLTHQLLPANFRSGELYGNEGATSQLSRIDCTRPEKTHRLFGSRLAQQLARHVDYDMEYASVSTRVNTRENTLQYSLRYTLQYTLRSHSRTLRRL